MTATTTVDTILGLLYSEGEAIVLVDRAIDAGHLDLAEKLASRAWDICHEVAGPDCDDSDFEHAEAAQDRVTAAMIKAGRLPVAPADTADVKDEGAFGVY